MSYLDHLAAVGAKDVAKLLVAQKSYGDSWKKRGGVGAFMMLARKWDRLENFLSKAEDRWDIFAAVEKDRRPEGVIDDIRDLRRYLLLVEAEMVAQGVVVAEVPKDLSDPPAAPQNEEPGDPVRDAIRRAHCFAPEDREKKEATPWPPYRPAPVVPLVRGEETPTEPPR